MDKTVLSPAAATGAAVTEHLKAARALLDARDLAEHMDRFPSTLLLEEAWELVEEIRRRMGAWGYG